MSRVFVSFAIEYKVLRDFLVEQKRNARNSKNFSGYTVEEPWNEKWKTECRKCVQMFAVMIGIINRITARASGQLWEFKFAIEEGVPLLLTHGSRDNSRRLKLLRKPIQNKPVYERTTDNILTFLIHL